jgi:syntaxin 1B/2/3
MNDLLGSVKGPAGVRQGAAQVYDIEAGFTTAQSERSKEMDEFFAQVEGVKQAIAAIKVKQREIQRMHEQSKTIVRKADMQQHRAEVQVRLPALTLSCAHGSQPAHSHQLSSAAHAAHVLRAHASTGIPQLLIPCFPPLFLNCLLLCWLLQEIINEVNTLAHQAKAKLEQVDKLNAAAQQKKGQGVGSASERTRTSITSGVFRVAELQEAAASLCTGPAHADMQALVAHTHADMGVLSDAPAVGSTGSPCRGLPCAACRSEEEAEGPDGGVQ